MQYLFCWKILIIKSMNTIAVKIKELRKSLNLTQKEFCERVGISQGYLSAIEKNPERSIGIEIAKRINIAFGVNLIDDNIDENTTKTIINGKEVTLIPRHVVDNALLQQQVESLQLEVAHLKGQLEVYKEWVKRSMGNERSPALELGTLQKIK